MTNKEKLIALDIYTYLYRTYYGTSEEEQNFRARQGTNGVVNKVLDYIAQKYLNIDRKYNNE